MTMQFYEITFSFNRPANAILISQPKISHLLASEFLAHIALHQKVLHEYDFYG